MAQFTQLTLSDLKKRLEKSRASGRWDEVEQLAEAILTQDSHHAPAMGYLCEGAQVRGDMQRAAELAETITRQWPENATAWLNLARIEGDRGRPESALRAYRQALTIRCQAPLILIQAAQALVRFGHSEQAELAASAAFVQAPPLRDAYRQPNQPSHVRKLSQLGNEIIRDRHWEKLSARLETVQRDRGEDLPRMRQFIDVFMGKKPLNYPHPLQQPSHLYVPGLTAKPWWERDEVPWVKDVEAAFDPIYAELREVLANDADLTPYIDHTPDTPEALEEIAGTLAWSAFHFYRHGRAIRSHIERCPDTMRVVHKMPLMTQQSHGAECFFSIVQPHSRIPAHVGHSNVKLGVHFPLIVPPDCGFRVGGETRRWETGKCLIFDDGFVHEVWNDSDAARVVLIFDMWHPDLNEGERHALDELTELDAEIRERHANSSVDQLLNEWPE